MADIFKGFMSAAQDIVSQFQAAKSTVNQSAAETARLARTGISQNQSPAETARLNRQSSAAKVVPGIAHKTDNIVTTPEVEEFDKIALNFRFQPNILDSYDVATYHWKLFITDPESSANGTIFNTDNQTIIAESGISDLTIDKVEIIGITTPTIESGTGISTNVKFEITEPSGAGLMDKLFYQSVSLGIGNWTVMPIYLQLEFKTREPGTSEANLGSMGNLEGLKWFWTTKFTSTKAHVSEVGTRYEITAIIYNEYAQSNSNFVIKQNTVLQDIENFGDAMKQLEDRLNAAQLATLVSNASIPDSYKIVVDPELAKYKITPIDKNTNSRRSDNFLTFDNKDATFSADTALDKVIDTLLSQSPDFQKKMLNAPRPGADGLPMPQEPNQMKYIWRIFTETRPLKFDPRRQDISKEFTIFIVEYNIGILDANVFQTSAPPLTLADERKRLLTYVKNKILKKKYDYLFTGLNDQILNFDLTINNAYTATQARFNGIYLNSAMSAKGVVNQDHAVEDANVSAKLNTAISMQNSAKTSNTVEARKSFEEAQVAIKTSSLPTEVQSRYLTLLEKSKPESRLNYLKEVQDRGGIDNNGELNSVRTRATNLAKPITEKVSLKQYNFISDVDPNSTASQDAYADFVKDSRGKLRPIARMESMEDRQIGQGVESNSNSGIQKLSNMFSTALHSGLDGSFQNIRLTIKGDPFWLFPQPVGHEGTQIFNSQKEQSEAINWLKNAHFKATDSVNIIGTDNFFIVRFRTPRLFNIDENPDTNTPNSDVETFSGVYKVTRVTSKFEGGKFTQELEALLDPEIRVLNVVDQLEAASKLQNVPTSPNDLISKNTFPITSVKTQTIMGGIPSSNDLLAQAKVFNNQLTNQIAGIQDQVRNAKGQIVELGSKTVGDASARLTSNIPTGIPNPLAGLPPIFRG
jgi:hypothetical protein